MKSLKLVSLVILVVLVGLQFFPARNNQNKEALLTDFISTYGVPDNVGKILKASCYNCHSNSTSYPWYSRVQPVGWFLESHINKGKAELNFSEFNNYSVRKQKSKLKSMVNQVENGEMPLASYTLMHREARLSEDSKKVFLNYLNSILDNIK